MIVLTFLQAPFLVHSPILQTQLPKSWKCCLSLEEKEGTPWYFKCHETLLRIVVYISKTRRELRLLIWTHGIALQLGGVPMQIALSKHDTIMSVKLTKLPFRWVHNSVLAWLWPLVINLNRTHLEDILKECRFCIFIMNHLIQNRKCGDCHEKSSCMLQYEDHNTLMRTKNRDYILFGWLNER